VVFAARFAVPQFLNRWVYTNIQFVKVTFDHDGYRGTETMAVNHITRQTYPRLLAGLRKFRDEVYPKRRQIYEKAAREPQQPHALLITCSDSRIDPELLTQSGPGEIFVTRNVGNLVPVYGDRQSAVSAVIEYAVAGLCVDDIVICGHTDCGAMKALLDRETLKGFPATRTWLGNAEAALTAIRSPGSPAEDANTLLQLIEENVLLQITHLKTHPFVAARLAEGTLSVHGWVYDIGQGDVRLYDPVPGQFVSIDATRATLTVEA
jgi:carbonic anhydrase